MVSDNSEDIIDSRDVIARATELAEQFTDHANGEENVDPLDDDEKAELDSLSALIDEASQYSSDWEFGETLIRDSYFTGYTQQLAEDCGMIPESFTNSNRWPMNHVTIDWEGAADDLKADYAEIDFDGIAYWIRSC